MDERDEERKAEGAENDWAVDCILVLVGKLKKTNNEADCCGYHYERQIDFSHCEGTVHTVVKGRESASSD